MQLPDDSLDITAESEINLKNVNCRLSEDDTVTTQT